MSHPYELVGRCDSCDVQYAKEYPDEDVTLREVQADVARARAHHAETCPGRVEFKAVCCDRSIDELRRPLEPTGEFKLPSCLRCGGTGFLRVRGQSGGVNPTRSFAGTIPCPDCARS